MSVKHAQPWDVASEWKYLTSASEEKRRSSRIRAGFADGALWQCTTSVLALSVATDRSQTGQTVGQTNLVK